jgi:putative ABC transport system permease protein
MLRNYITIAIRNLIRQFLYSFINILGLAIGMACSLIIILYVYGEWSYDRHYTNAERIYRIGVSFFNMGNFAKSPEALEDVLPKEFEGVEIFTSFQKSGGNKIFVKDQGFEEVTYYVDSVFFTVFDHEFAAGNGEQAIMNSSSAVLTESMARKLFKDPQPIGQTLEVGESKVPYTVTAIVQDTDLNSHLKAKIWLGRDPKMKYGEGWSSAAVYSYVLLREGVTVNDLRTALDQIVAKHVHPSMSNGPLEDYLKDENSVKFHIQPLRDIYLKSKFDFEVSPGGNETNMYIFAVIAAFILVLAAVNFINLSTARATRRSKEVGIRKALGTSRSKLVWQFLLESIFICILSMIIALGISELFVFGFFWITGQELTINLWSNGFGLFGVLIFAVIIGLLAGIYPALYLTSFQAAKVLKGNTQPRKTQQFRNALVIFQFAISITLIITSVVIVRQLDFMEDKDLGFDDTNVVTIENLYGLKPSTAIAFKNELLNIPGVTGASLHAGEPASKAILAFYTYQTKSMENALTINTYFGDEDYLDVMGYRLIAGRNFDADLASDTSSVIINEAAVRALDLDENPIGAIVNENQKIIGVVKDFHWESLRNEIGPTAIVLQSERSRNVSYSQLALKFNSPNPLAILKQAEAKWKELLPADPMTFHFLDENFGAVVEKEHVLGKAIGFFTILAILISCLGLFGLAAYTTEQRTKEIGIRKVLGASVSNIVLLLNKQFTLLVMIAIAIAIPVSYYAASEWLSEFAYRIDLSVWLFLGGSLIGLTISYLTVAFHSFRASKTNPAETLKWE